MKIPKAAPPAGFVWFPEYGMGYYPTPDGSAVYDDAYWEKYQAYDATDLGRALTAARVALVSRWWGSERVVVDVGIGAGAFVQAIGETHTAMGWDVNPRALDWLKAKGRLWNPLAPSGGLQALTFWDCLEHIKEPDELLASASAVFISVPIFSGPDHVLASKHYRKDEHCWYWTRQGLIAWMAARGFFCAEHSTPESLLGREDIGSFAFLRPFE